MRGILYGFAGGGVVVAAMALVYSQSRAAFLSPVFQWSLTVIYLVAMILAALRRPPAPRIEAIRSALVCYLLASASYYLYTYLLYEAFDPELYELQSELMIANAERFQSGQPGRLADSPAVLYAPERLRYTLSGIAYNYAFGALSGAAVSFLLGTLLGRGDDPDTTTD